MRVQIVLEYKPYMMIVYQDHSKSQYNQREPAGTSITYIILTRRHTLPLTRRHTLPLTTLEVIILNIMKKMKVLISTCFTIKRDSTICSRDHIRTISRKTCIVSITRSLLKRTNSRKCPPWPNPNNYI